MIKKRPSDKFDQKTYYSIENTCGQSKCNICVANNHNCGCSSELGNSNISKLKVVRKRRVILPKHITIKSDDDNVMYECTVCNTSFTSRTNSIYHRYCDNAAEKPYKCEYCGKQFSTKTHYSYHILDHTGKLPFPCKYCDKSFKTNAKLRRHEDVHTKKTDNYKCNICERKFSFKSYFQIHMKRHLNENSYECDVCHRKFSDKKSITYHVSAHLGMKEFTCEYCGKSYRSKWNLELHQTTHERLRPFVCKVCNKSFSQKRYLQKHVGIHEDDQFVCMLCEKSFSRKDNLQRHILNSHLEYEEVDVVADKTNPKETARAKSLTNKLAKQRRKRRKKRPFKIAKNPPVIAIENGGTIIPKERITELNASRATSVIKVISKTDGVVKDFDFKKRSSRYVSVIRTTSTMAATYRSKINNTHNDRYVRKIIRDDYRNNTFVNNKTLNELTQRPVYPSADNSVPFLMAADDNQFVTPTSAEDNQQTRKLNNNGEILKPVYDEPVLSRNQTLKAIVHLNDYELTPRLILTPVVVGEDNMLASIDKNDGLVESDDNRIIRRSVDDYSILPSFDDQLYNQSLLSSLDDDQLIRRSIDNHPTADQTTINRSVDLFVGNNQLIPESVNSLLPNSLLSRESDVSLLSSFGDDGLIYKPVDNSLLSPVDNRLIPESVDSFLPSFDDQLFEKSVDNYLPVFNYQQSIHKSIENNPFLSPFNHLFDRSVDHSLLSPFDGQLNRSVDDHTLLSPFDNRLIDRSMDNHSLLSSFDNDFIPRSADSRLSLSPFDDEINRTQTNSRTLLSAPVDEREMLSTPIDERPVLPIDEQRMLSMDSVRDLSASLIDDSADESSPFVFDADEFVGNSREEFNHYAVDSDRIDFSDNLSSYSSVDDPLINAASMMKSEIFRESYSGTTSGNTVGNGAYITSIDESIDKDYCDLLDLSMRNGFNYDYY